MESVLNSFKINYATKTPIHQISPIADYQTNNFSGF